MLPEDQKRILGYFIEEAKDHLNSIEQGLLNLQTTVDDPEAINEVFRAAHSVKGGAAMLGLDSIQRTAHRMEDYFKALKETPVEADRPLESMLLQVFDGLSEQLEQLQGPFGLTEDKAQDIMGAIEPLFQQVDQHLEQLAQTAPKVSATSQAPASTPPEPATESPVSAPTAAPYAEASALQLVFKSDVPALLREMLSVFKQTDNAASRQSLRDICQQLHRMGGQFELSNWCSLTNVATQVVTNQEHTYRTLAPVVIRELKAAQDRVLRGLSQEISVSESLQELLPVNAEAAAAEDESLDELLNQALSSDAGEPDLADLFEEAEETSEASTPDDLATADWLTAIPDTEADGNVDQDFSEMLNQLESGSFQDDLTTEPASESGPAVGAAELNSLADLFEGEIAEFDQAWEEEPDDIATDPSIGNTLDADISDDFADLLLDQESEDSSTEGVNDDLASLFGTALPEDMAGTAGDDLPMAADANAEDGAFAEDETPSEDAVAWDFDLDVGEVSDTNPDITVEEAGDDASFDWPSDGTDIQLSADEELSDLDFGEAEEASDLSLDVGLEAEQAAEAEAASAQAVVPLEAIASGEAQAVTASSDTAWSDLDFDVEGDNLGEDVADFDSLLSVAEDSGSNDTDFLDLLGEDSDVDSNHVEANSSAVDAPSSDEIQLEDPWTDTDDFELDSSMDGALTSDDDFDSLFQVDETSDDESGTAATAFEDEDFDFLDELESDASDTAAAVSRADPMPAAMPETASDADAEFDLNFDAASDDAEEIDLDAIDWTTESAGSAPENMAASALNIVSGDMPASEEVDEADSPEDDVAIAPPAEADVAATPELTDPWEEALSTDDSSQPEASPSSSQDDLEGFFALDTDPPATEITSTVETNDLEGFEDFFETPSADAIDLGSEPEDSLLEINPEDSAEAPAHLSPDEATHSADASQNVPSPEVAGLEANASDEALENISPDGEETSPPETATPPTEESETAIPRSTTSEQAASPATDTLGEVDQLLGDDTAFESAVDNDFDLDAPMDDDPADTDANADLTDSEWGDLDALAEETPAAEAAPQPDVDDFDLGDLDALMDDSPADTDADIDPVDGEPQPDVDDFDLGDLDALMDDDPADTDPSADLTDSEWGDLDALAEETPDSFNHAEAGSAEVTGEEWGDLESLVNNEAPDREITASDTESDTFTGLDALLADNPPSSPAVDNVPTVTTPQQTDAVGPESSASLLDTDAASDEAADDEFEDLEKLLEEADQLGGSSPITGIRRIPSNSPRHMPRRPTGMRDQTMRVSVQHLDTLSNLVGEMVVNRNSLEQDQERLRQFLENLLFQVQQLNDVGQRMRDLYERSLLESSLMSSRQAFQATRVTDKGERDHATGANFDALEMDRFTGFHTLTQEMIELIVRVRESASDIGFTIESTDQVTRQFRQVTTQLQEGLNKARMVPFAQTADRLPRAVRDISLKCGREAKLVVEGRDTLIDKMILERLYDPMTHLVNNAITHGIETPEERLAAGKPREGIITVRAFYQGNQTVIYIADDGAGINPNIIREKALNRGLISQEDAQEMADIELYELLFLPGFSTRDQADDFAGRGVGMDVVRTALAEIRGAVTVDSELGQGTGFTIRLPLTLSISKALSCVNNQARIAFPMDGVEDMFDAPRDRIQENDRGQPCILWRDTLLPFRPLSDLLQFNRTLSRGRVYGGPQEEDVISIVVLRSANTYIALQVDQVIGEQEIVIKQLEGPVPKPMGIAGATVLGDGRVMPIADVLELIDLSLGRTRREAAPSPWAQAEESDAIAEPDEPKTATESTVLIVDDSITVRELLSMSFNKVGYRVEQARDGQEAWEKLRSGLPCDLVFCDIEMPRMDGLELLSRMQKDSGMSQIPIAMLTSRGADRHRQMAVELGAKGYFTKPYLEEVLLDAAERMLNGENMAIKAGESK